MQDSDFLYFYKLLEEVYCGTFRKPFSSISRSEAKVLAIKINAVTGSTLSDKTLINYYKAYVTHDKESINPTLITLDILTSYYWNKRYNSQKNELGMVWLEFKKINYNSKTTLDNVTIHYSKGRYPLIFISLIVVLIIFFYILYIVQKPNYFRDEFSGLVNGMKLSNNWLTIFKDSTWFNKQKSNEHLTLYTLPGGFWVKNYENPIVRNTLLTKIEDRDFEINIKIDSFIPYEKYQQVGIILSNDLITFDNIVIFNLDFTLQNNEILKCAEGKIGVALTHVYQHNGVQYGSWILNNLEDYNTYKSRIHHVWLKIIYRRENRKIFAFAKVEDEFKEYFKIGQTEGLFSPKFAGISAYQGLTDDFGNALNAEIDPVLIDYFELIYQ